MALLFIDGFDHYATADIGKKWSTITGSPAIGAAAGRRGSGALQINLSGAEGVTKTFASSYTTLIVGVAFSISQAIGGARSILTLKDGTTSHLLVRLNTDNTLSVVRAAGSIVVATTAAITIGAFVYLEFKATIDDTTGSFSLRLNGAEVAAGSGIDTRNAGNASVNSVYIGFDGNPGSVLTLTVDDLYICDTSGSKNNDFLGDVRVDTLLPTGDGTYKEFTPSAGTDHYALVDETTLNEADYVESDVVGERDSFTTGGLPALVSQTIFGVQVNASAKKSDAGSRSLSTLVRSGTTDSEGSASALSTSTTTLTQMFENDPDGSVAWTEAKVNAAEFGAKVAA